MPAEIRFTIANNGVIPFWLLLAIAPGWKGTRSLVPTFAIPMLLAVLYLYLAVTRFGWTKPFAPTIAEASRLL